MKGFLRAGAFNLFLGVLILFSVIFLQFRNLNLSVFFLKDIKLEVNNKVENSEYILNDIMVNVRGLKILLSKLNPLVVLETGLNLLPVSYKVQDLGIYVYFEKNIFLGFLVDSENNFSIESNLSKSFLLSYEIENNYEILLNEPTISIRQGEGDSEYKVFLGENVKIREKDILISPQSIFRIGDATYIDSSKKSISNSTIEDNKRDISDYSVMYSKIKEVNNKIFNDTLNNFRQSAYNYWNSPVNFNASKGGWLKYGVYDFDENLMVCFLAESLIRGNHKSIFLKLDSLLVKNEHKLTYLSLCYYANSDQIDKFFAYLSRNKTFIDSLEKDRLVVYLKEDPLLLEKIFLSENGSKLNDALNLLKNPGKILSSNFNFSQTYNILSNYLTFLKISNDDSVYLSFKKELYKFVFTLFGITDEGIVHILNDNINPADTVEHALKISGVLKRIASYLRDDLILKLSFNMIYYSLVSDYAKGIPYESYYSDIIDNQYMPQFIFISDHRSRRWIYAASRVLNREITDTKLMVNFDQEINYSSYMFFGNILNPSLVRFREIDWFTDYKFYIYSDGWKYYPLSKVLVIKATPKQKKTFNLLLRFDNNAEKVNIYE
ncbi:hypothetical protein QIA41_01660 [Borreliella sinica]|uniref:hypothetical protein n=1 Tax=Borreliella sinica TaxID=87162 RepID=UPI002A242E1C|nr:hypothetical protein [Borreliella sinica]WPM05807.1 hypothetical protein QIA41_01660 [Borreliella sinica]